MMVFEEDKIYGFFVNLRGIFMIKGEIDCNIIIMGIIVYLCFFIFVVIFKFFV